MKAMQFKKATITAAAVAALGVMAGSAQAATEAQKRAAIDSGLAYLATQQQADGRWVYSGGAEDGASTGSALLAFLEEKPNWGVNAAAYQTVVDKGLNYLFAQAQAVAISNQPAGNPDTNGNGIGLKFVPGGVNGRDTYVTGLVLPAIAKAAFENPGALVTVGSQAGRTYAQVVQDTVDYFAYGQNDSGYARGGWRYYANSGDADNSTAQWPAIGMLYGQAVPGVTVPGFVKTELKEWIDYIQNTTNGGSGYDSPGNLVNEAKTGGLLVEMAFAGYDGTSTGAGDKSDKAGALAYLNTHWKDGPSATWDGNFGHPYAMWSIYKGLETTIGMEDTTAITNLLTDCGTLDAGDACNWFQDYAEWLVQSQNANGSWTGYDAWSSPLATPWFINILAATQVPDGGDVPEPGTAALVGLALAGLAASRRRKPA
ncbi:MAG: PEP-CTERM sorting domain-containing protein [Rubrivivax sp.]|nr:PEP-CTERM sorting domain-containing protein [Rubrivivax sp.]